MRPDFDNPNYWKSLYKRPTESNTQGVVAGSTEVEAGDLEAELDPYAADAEQDVHIDHQAVMGIVEQLVEKRLQALMAQGWGPKGAAPPPNPRSAPPPQRRAQGPAPFQDPPPQRRPTPPPAARPGVGAAMWERVPRLPGGQAALFNAGDLGQEAIQLLVMVDGSTSLQGLRLLVPHLEDQAFLGIIRSAIKKGILDIS